MALDFRTPPGSLFVTYAGDLRGPAPLPAPPPPKLNRKVLTPLPFFSPAPSLLSYEITPTFFLLSSRFWPKDQTMDLFFHPSNFRPLHGSALDLLFPVSPFPFFVRVRPPFAGVLSL